MRRAAPGKDPDGRGFPQGLLPHSRLQLRGGGFARAGADGGREKRPVQSQGPPFRIHRAVPGSAHLAVRGFRVSGRRMRLPAEGGRGGFLMRAIGVLAGILAAAAVSAQPAATVSLSLQEATRRALERNTTLAVERENL